MHLAIYAATNAGAVVHTHSAEVIALSAVRDELPADPLRDHRPRRAGPRRSLHAVRVGRPGAGGGQRRWTAAGPRSCRTTAPSATAATLRRGLRPRAAAGVAGAGVPAGLQRTVSRGSCPRPSWTRSPPRRGGAATASGDDDHRERNGGPRQPRHQRRQRPGLAEARAAVQSGAHILDVLGRPVETIPAGQGSARLTEIRATAAGTAAGTAVDLAKLGARVARSARSATTCSPTSCWPAHGNARRGHQPALVRKAGRADLGHDPADPAQRRAAGPARAGRDPAAAAADMDLAGSAAATRCVLGGPDALAGLSGRRPRRPSSLRPGRAARWSLVDVLHPGSRAGLQPGSPARSRWRDWFCPNSDQLLALTGRADLERPSPTCWRSAPAAWR